MARNHNNFQTVHSEGGLLPSDLLRRVINPKENIPGTRPEDYGLDIGERINEKVTQSWSRLHKVWADFSTARNSLSEGEAGTGLTNDRWNLPLLRELGFGMLPTTPGPEIDGRTYAINRFSGPIPIHLIGCGLNLDRRASGARGAALVNPHGLVQEFLNRSDEHLWAIVSNGMRLRILRDSQALSRQSYLEFDLEAMFDGEAFSDFVLLWLMAHATRFIPQGNDRPESCWLEQWTEFAEEQGARALGELRNGVERALQILGQGFVGHPRNTELRETLRSGKISLSDFHGQLLRLVYRLIFLFVAEDRSLEGVSLLHPLDDSERGRKSRERYAAHYSTSRLRELASKIRGSRHGDLWQQFNLLVGTLSGDDRFTSAREQLALPVFGSFLWDPASTYSLNTSNLNGGGGTELSNHDFLEAIRHIAFTRQGKVLRPVDYKNIGAEEIGGVYESLLALTPQISGDGARFAFAEFAGNERKTSGSYYTPDSLVQCLLDSALDPVVEKAIEGKAGKEAERAILALNICDPAVGSGHFLVGAAHRLARHLARVRALGQGESEPSPKLYHEALREVIGHCLYGVDINPMSAELCRVSLWLEALEPGKPLTFLDHHIRVGNSLLGCTPDLLKAGIPDDAFKPIEGDEKQFCRDYKKKNRDERRSQQHTLFSQDLHPWQHLGNLGTAMSRVDKVDDSTPEGLKLKTEAFNGFVRSSGYLSGKFLHDVWCAAFVWKRWCLDELPYPITQATIDRIERQPHDCPLWMKEEIERLALEYRFFHWHLEFPDVFGPEGKGGFDIVLGNPPWERVKLQEKEWFAERSPEIANAPNAAARKRLIAQLVDSDSGLLTKFKAAQRLAEGESHLLRNSRLYPLCGRGDINLYTVFAEVAQQRLSKEGRMGLVLPSGIATDDTTKFYFQDVVESCSLVSLFDFENKGIFPGVHSSQKFCLFTAGSGRHEMAEQATEFVFFAHSVDELEDPERRFTLSPKDIELLNPNTRTCPIFRSKKDAELTKYIYRRVPVLICEARDGQAEENSWGISFMRMFDMSNDSHLFRTREQLEPKGWRLEGNVFEREDERYLPLYEAKMVNFFDHRAADVRFSAEARQRKAQPSSISESEKADSQRSAIPLFWVSERDCDAAFPVGYNGTYVLGFASVTSPTNERTFCPALAPRCGAGNSFPLIFSNRVSGLTALLMANQSSYVFDYEVRQKVGGVNLNFYLVNQFPILSHTIYSNQCLWAIDELILCDWLLPRVLELTYTAWDLESFAHDCSWSGPPFRWDEDRRFLLRCELDAAYFHLYLGSESEWREKGTQELLAAFPSPRHAAEYIMETFPIVKRKDEAAHGCYRTKETILEIYDEMAEVQRTGQPYGTRLDPPPADPSCCHPPRLRESGSAGITT